MTVVRCTPSMSARNSWVSATVSLEMRSWQVSSQRQKRASTECRALQATDWMAWPYSASVWRSTRSRMRGLFSQASCSRSALMRAARSGVWTMARDSDCRGATAAIRPSAPFRPDGGAISIAAPLSIRVISEITPSWGK